MNNIQLQQKAEQLGWTYFRRYDCWFRPNGEVYALHGLPKTVEELIKLSDEK